MAIRTQTVGERFARLISPEPNTGCWLWTGAHGGNGYGKFKTNKTTTWWAHRLAWTLHKGPIPTGMMVCHHCDTPICVNPDHLFIGDAAANLRDMTAKGRRVNSNDLKTHCPKGHAYTKENTYIGTRGASRRGTWRACRICRTVNHKIYKSVIRNRIIHATPKPEDA
jgi:hypothetical protein